MMISLNFNLSFVFFASHINENVQLSRSWLNILKLYPQTSISQNRTTANGGRAKRSQTFPGMRSFQAFSMPPQQQQRSGFNRILAIICQFDVIGLRSGLADDVNLSKKS